MKEKRVEFAVAFTIPPGAKVVDCVQYVEEALSCYRGSLRPPGSYNVNDPGDAMFGLDRDTIVVKRFLKKGRRYRETVNDTKG